MRTEGRGEEGESLRREGDEYLVFARGDEEVFEPAPGAREEVRLIE
ncbi:MAG TPA: hypothetical protein VF883_23395 [Thermoanaerobaculia bacterium]